MPDASSTVRARTRSVDATRALGEALAPVLEAGDVVALSGDLAAGKTAFVQGVARGLGSTDHVVSPTFMLVREYEGRLRILHMDVYRLDRLQDVWDLGFEDLLDEGGVVLIEWGDVIEGILPVDHLLVRLRFPDEEEPNLRSIELTGHGPSWRMRTDRLSDAARPWAEREG
jgi:tRNA threonylcarbamoyladenosine biosynthesis protein TsaE